MTKTEAEFAAANCIKKMSPDWKSVVFENLGWHWRVTNGKIDIHEGLNGKYHAMVSTKVGHCVNIGSSGYHKDPNKAVKELLKKVGEHIGPLMEVIKSV